MVLDECPEYPVSHEAAAAAMRRTVSWARRGVSHWRSRMESSEGYHALFAIVQGSMFPDLRRECARALADLDTDGYAVGEPRPLSLEAVDALPLNRVHQ